MPQHLSSIATALRNLSGLSVYQQIRSISVRPGPRSVVISFFTTHPAIPIVEIFRLNTGIRRVDMVKGNLAGVVFPIFGGLQSSHKVRIDNLQQDSEHWFRITAGSQLTKNLAVRTGKFFTTKREASIFIDELRVMLDGDPGGSGEMVFKFAVYDTDQTRLIESFRLPNKGERDIKDGSLIFNPFGSPASIITKAPDRLTLFFTGLDMDCFLQLCALGEAFPKDQIPEPTAGEDGLHEWTDAMQTFRLADSVGNHVEPIRIDSGRFAVRYEILGKIVTKILPPKKKFTQPGVAEFPRLSLIRDAGQISGAGRMGGKLQLITLAPDRTVYRYLINADAFHGSRAGWENIGGQASGPLTVLSSDNGRIDLFAPGPKATALHAHWNINDEISPVPEWNDLGGKVRGDIIAVRSESERIDLFAAGEDHAVYHKTVMDDGRSDARGDWRSLGGMFRDPMMAIRSTQGGFEVFATGMDGGVFHKRYSDAKDGEPSVEEWECLGGQFNGVLVAELSDNENIMLLAFSDDRMAYYKTWNGKNWEPSKTEWISIGSIDSLEDALSENNGPEVEGAPNTECI